MVSDARPPASTLSGHGLEDQAPGSFFTKPYTLC
jgi:hypothetical protein